MAENGEPIILARRKKPVARIVPENNRPKTRIGGLAGRSYHFSDKFDVPDLNGQISDDFEQSS